MPQRITQTNIKRLISNINNTNIYTPIIEAIVNSMQAIDDKGSSGGKIKISINRNSTLLGESSDQITSIIIEDNGIGFDEKNLSSFDEIYSEHKIEKGGKGFGRLTFLKYFSDADIESVFQKNGKLFKRTFKFVPENNIIQGEQTKEITDLDGNNHTGTKITLNNLKKSQRNKIDKTAETIGRKILEQLLVYFVLDNYECPVIEVVDSFNSGQCTLNTYIGKDKNIQEIPLKEDSFTLTKKIKQSSSSEEASTCTHKATFKIKAFKVFYTKHRSDISLVADNRAVTEQSIHSYVPEFKDDFVHTNEDGKTKNYSVKAYVMSPYLDEHISPERGEFYFQKNESNDEHPFSQTEIEAQAISTITQTFSEDITTRQNKKKARIQEYVNKTAYWHRNYIDSLDFSKIPYDISDRDLEMELQKVKFETNHLAQDELKSILEDDGEKNYEKIQQLVDTITESSTSDFVHYIASRKVILEVFEEGLKWSQDDHKYELEKTIHDIIFPTGKSSLDVPENEHNLWMLDERLNFHEYLYSDKPLNPNGDRPDIVVFDNKVTVRGGSELSNPIVVFEFKRPGRNDYSASDDPIKQTGKYIEQIRTGKCKSFEGTKISANENTPAYGYVVCDITDKIEGFCKDHQFTKSPDTLGYFGYHRGYNTYFEVVSFEKLLKDAKERNSIFFNKLGIL